MKRLLIWFCALLLLAGCAKEYDSGYDPQQVQEDAKLAAQMLAADADNQAYRSELKATIGLMFDKYQSILKLQPPANATQEMKNRYKHFYDFIAEDANKIVDIHADMLISGSGLSPQKTRLTQAAKELAAACQTAKDNVDKGIYDNPKVLELISYVGDLSIEAAD